MTRPTIRPSKVPGAYVVNTPDGCGYYFRGQAARTDAEHFARRWVFLNTPQPEPEATVEERLAEIDRRLTALEEGIAGLLDWREAVKVWGAH